MLLLLGDFTLGTVLGLGSISLGAFDLLSSLRLLLFGVLAGLNSLLLNFLHVFGDLLLLVDGVHAVLHGGRAVENHLGGLLDSGGVGVGTSVELDFTAATVGRDSDGLVADGFRSSSFSSSGSRGRSGLGSGGGLWFSSGLIFLSELIVGSVFVVKPE